MSEDDEDERANPFEDLESAVGEREGDPFEELSSPDSSEEEASSRVTAAEDGPDTITEGTHPREEERSEHGERFDQQEPFAESGFEALEPEPDSEPTGAGAETEPVTEDHRSQPTDSPTEMSALSDTDTRQGDPFQSLEDAFSEVDVEGLDPDAVWEELTSAQSRGSISDSRKRTYAEVSKHAYCEGCEHFSKPPDIHCTNEGTEIVEFLDMETVRVVDCPVVTERAQLESGGHGKD